jgi:hypothetical protein
MTNPKGYKNNKHTYSHHKHSLAGPRVQIQN